MRQRSLDAAVLVSQRDLEVIDIFTVALESEMARFDNACMNGPDGDLMDFRSVHLEKLRNAHRIGCCSEQPFAFTIGRWKRIGLSQGCPDGHNSPLLGNFPLEPVRLRTVGRQ